ncbi:MAG: Vms1/Ankzf1 family peptidyl-tRNA hydrolase [Chloroflexota bacterium]
MRDVLRRLAEYEPADLPTLSIYLDMRPQATGQNPALRSGRIVLKDRLHEIEKTLGPRGPALDSFQADAERIEHYLDEQAPSESQGLAIFACHGRGLFEVVPTATAFENQVTADRVPDLFQLARLLDEHETAVVAVVDTNTARLFVVRVDGLQEAGGPDDDSIHYRKRSTGGWSEARYQRHIENHRSGFAREAAAQIEQLVNREGAQRLLLAGDEVAITSLRDALSQSVAALIPGDALRVGIRTSRDEVESEVTPVLARIEAEEACGIGDRLVQAVRAGGLGAAGLDATRGALAAGQVDTLVIDPDGPVDENTRNDLIRQAATTDATVEIVQGHAAFSKLGGVGALLRYRFDDATTGNGVVEEAAASTR